ncbi:MAG: hypothetical protein WD960_15925 [Gemmatimonadota bacterium]
MVFQQRWGALLLLLLFSGSCSPTSPWGEPNLLGPDEVAGVWSNYQIVCTIPLTMTTPFPILITGGELFAVFPRAGHPIAFVEQTLTSAEITTLWGSGVSARTTRSLEIFPTVQFEDYRVTVTFGYDGGGRSGEVSHSFDCVPGSETIPNQVGPSSGLAPAVPGGKQEHGSGFDLRVRLSGAGSLRPR